MIELTDWTGEFEWISTNWIGTCVQYQRSILYTKCCVIWHQEENNNEKIICIDDVLNECSVLIRIILMRNALWKCKPDYDNVGLSVKKVVNILHPWWTNSGYLVPGVYYWILIGLLYLEFVKNLRQSFHPGFPARLLQADVLCLPLSPPHPGDVPAR